MFREHIFTDGSCINNGKFNSKGGYAIFFKDNDIRNFCSKQTDPCSNQKGELLAILKAFESASEKSNIELVICTDSMYCINIYTKWIHSWEKNNWKKKDNQDISHLKIIKNTQKLINKRKDQFKQKILFQHINSHQKQPRIKDSYEYYLWYGNKQVDKLSRICI